MKRLWFAFVAMLAMGFAGQAFPQPFPNKPVRILIGPGAGGPTDVMMRTYASKMTDRRNPWPASRQTRTTVFSLPVP